MPTETFQSIHEWAVGTFGEAKWQRTVCRAEEEFEELNETSSLQDALEEAADVVITLCNLPGLAEAIDRKMEINRNRKWKIMGDGTGYHE